VDFVEKVSIIAKEKENRKSGKVLREGTSDYQYYQKRYRKDSANPNIRPAVLAYLYKKFGISEADIETLTLLKPEDRPGWTWDNTFFFDQMPILFSLKLKKISTDLYLAMGTRFLPTVFHPKRSFGGYILLYKAEEHNSLRMGGWPNHNISRLDNMAAFTHLL
jgi:hypothetical protein